MQDLFGIPMNSIMLVLLALLGIAMACVGYVVVRNRIMFFIGLRNIPRRPAQTVLIIVGLMLSTLIISTAFTTGDTVDHSLTATSFRLLGHVDMFIRPQGEGREGPANLKATIAYSDATKIRQALASNPNIDGVLPVMWSVVPVINPTSRQSEPSVNFGGLDATARQGFPDVISQKTGQSLDPASLANDELYMNASAADKLNTKAGDRVHVFVNGQPNEFKVVDIVRA